MYLNMKIGEFTDGYSEYQIPEGGNKVFVIGYIYYLFYKERLVYIGQTIDLHSRIYSHKTTKLFDRVLFKECPAEELDSVEKSEILKYLPIYNAQYISKKIYQESECDFLLEFDDFYIIRGVGKSIAKTNCYIKNNIMLILLDSYSEFSNRHQYVDLNKRVIGRTIHEQGHFIYDPEKHRFIKQPTVYVKSNGYKKSNGTSSQFTIPDSYIFPVGKYKGLIYRNVNDNSYKVWYYENVYIKGRNK